ncbi:dehydroquinate synthase/iron-containing alcohol dehydrogenase family protein [Nocardia terpenica]|uniref:Fe-containing alcohol dehydrogenase-like C-terminal domain-containing protein n=1 Tax=Nocardia terpenica TaxID=455432 RepID=A0A291RMA4_9NOCA|nr:hypothetical protein CRH09_23480 [Nocardia terpenica]
MVAQPLFRGGHSDRGPHVTAESADGSGDADQSRLESLVQQRPPAGDGLLVPRAHQDAAESPRLTTAAPPAAVADGSDLEARSRMLICAHLAGRALALSGLGLVHGIGHALTAALGTPHGVALAAIVSQALRFGLDTAPDRYAELLRALALRVRSSMLSTKSRHLQWKSDYRRPWRLLVSPTNWSALWSPKTLADAVTRNVLRIPTLAELTVLLRESLCAGWLPVGRGVPGL